ncbi:MAG: PepSY domain-containing protein [Thermomicrobiales bacterium]|nr:PepSY domain-containing protein [Thermomicrobiales bacterium]
MTNGRMVILAGASVLLLGGLAGLPDRSEAQETATPSALLQPAVDLLTAQETALTEFPSAQVISVELERERGGLVYEVSLTSGGVDVDATSGAVLRVDPED